MYQKCPMVALYSPLKYCYTNPILMFFPVDICGPRKTNLGPIEVATTFSHQARSKALVSLVKAFETPYNGRTRRSMVVGDSREARIVDITWNFIFLSAVTIRRSRSVFAGGTVRATI